MISNVDVAPYRSVDRIKHCLIASLCAQVRWHETAVLLAAKRPDFIIECGAAPVLTPMMKRLPGSVNDRIFHVGDAAGVAALTAAAEKLPA